MDERLQTYKDLGNTLAHHRNQRGLSQEQLSEVLGIPQRTYAGYELGVRKIPLDVLNELSKYFGVPVQHLLGQGIYAKKELIRQHMMLIIEQIKADIYTPPNMLIENSNGQKMPMSLAELLESVDFETQFKILSVFIFDVEIDEINHTFRIFYYL